MKKVFLFLVVLFFSVISYAQKDRFTDYTQLVKNSVVLYDLNTLILSNGKFIYRQVEGKLKAVSPKELVIWGNYLELNCVEIINVKNKQYIHCVHQDYGDLFLLINTKKNDYINKFRNLTYWDSILDAKKEEYAYLYESNSPSKRLIDKYLRIYWGCTEFPLTNIDDEVLFHYAIENRDDANVVSYSDFINNTDNMFRSKFEYEQSKIEQHKLDSIQEIKDKKQDAYILRAVCTVDKHTFGTGKYDYISKDDTVFVYYVEDSFMKGWSKYDNVKIDNFYMKPVDYEQYKFVKSRGSKNVNYRDSIAKDAASKYAKRELARIEKEIEEIQARMDARLKEIKNKQLFFKDVDYAYGEYSDFGLKFEIHNCWNKTIKYVEFTATAYNAVGDVQRDWVGKSVSKTKGIGPLEPGETATWSFNDMFYDKNDVIRKAKLTKITFLFEDGTSKTFTGNSNINKHRW